MKKSSSSKPGNKNKQVSNLKMKTPEMHDTPVRRHPPTPQDIQRVQPVSQSTQHNHPGKSETKGRKGNQ